MGGSDVTNSQLVKVFTICQVFVKFREYNIDLCCPFIDFKQTFYSLNRAKIKYTLIISGMPAKFSSFVNIHCTIQMFDSCEVTLVSISINGKTTVFQEVITHFTTYILL